MKQTFETNTYLKDIPNAEVYEFLVKYARSKGVPVYEYTQRSSYSEFPALIFQDHICGAKKEFGTRTKVNITMEQFFQYCDNWKEAQTHKVVLNDEYIAKIDFECSRVIVGCQNFSFNVIEELYNKIKQQ